MAMQEVNVTAVPQQHSLKGLAKRLVNDDVLSTEQALSATQGAEKLNISLTHYLTEHEHIPSLIVAHATMQEFGIPYLDMTQFTLEQLPKKRLKTDWLKQRHVLPLYENEQRLYVAISDPSSLSVLDEIRFSTGKYVEAVIVDHHLLTQQISRIIKGVESGGASELDEMSADLKELAAQSIDDNFDAPTGDIDDTPIVRFVNQTLLDAIDKGASDLHFEPYEECYRVRFRIDGILYEMASPPVAMGARIATRLKVMAQLNIAERRVPQDGKMKLRLSRTSSVDMRVSTCPTTHGEKVVVRILDPNHLDLNIDILGFDPKQQQLYLDALHQPHGMILVTGPTGSGKTVSLYTGLKLLNTIDKNIATVEDPVEIYMTGVNQVNVNPKAGLDFATALRSFLRQDPDVVMVGEIRDIETAEIAIKASQTGHLVLSTLHTNSAEETISRLLHMGIEPFNIATSVNLIIAQRLMRKLCDNCKKTASYSESLLKTLQIDPKTSKDNIYQAVGCKKCTDGYRGRVGIYQVMPVSKSIKELIVDGASALKIGAQAQSEGVMSLSQAAVQKVLQGLSTIEEMSRVTHQPASV